MDRFEEYAETTYLVKKNYLKREITEEDMNWYNQLWMSNNAEAIYRRLNVDGDNKEEIIADLMKIQPRYKSFADFVKNIDKMRIQEEKKNE